MDSTALLVSLKRNYARGSIFRPSEIESTARDRGYIRSRYPQLDGSEWLASHFANLGLMPTCPQEIFKPDGPKLRFRNGDLVPLRGTPEYVCEVLNQILTH